MFSVLESLFDELVAALTPEMALAGGIPMPIKHGEKPNLILCKGKGGFLGTGLFAGGGGGSTPQIAPPPAAPVVNVPPPPPAPPPPPPAPSASSQDVAFAQQQGIMSAANGFGWNASLLKQGPGGTSGSSQGPTMSANSGSLLGN